MASILRPIKPRDQHDRREYASKEDALQSGLDTRQEFFCDCMSLSLMIVGERVASIKRRDAWRIIFQGY
jgi:hypothetical protein